MPTHQSDLTDCVKSDTKTLREHLTDFATLNHEIRALPSMKDDDGASDGASEWWIVDRIYTALYEFLKEQDDRVELWIMDGMRYGDRPHQTMGPDHVHAHCLYLKIPGRENPDIWTLSFDSSEREVEQSLYSILSDDFERHYADHLYEDVQSSVSSAKLEGNALAEYLDDNPSELTLFVRSFFQRKTLAVDTSNSNPRQPGLRL